MSPLGEKKKSPKSGRGGFRKVEGNAGHAGLANFPSPHVRWEYLFPAPQGEQSEFQGPPLLLTRTSSLALGSGELRLEAKEAGLSTRSRRAGTQMGAFPHGVEVGLGGSEGWS